MGVILSTIATIATIAGTAVGVASAAGAFSPGVPEVKPLPSLPQLPTPAAPKKPAEQAKDMTGTAEAIAQREEIKRARARKGRGSTILTSGLGVQGPAPVERKSLLGA